MKHINTVYPQFWEYTQPVKKGELAQIKILPGSTKNHIGDMLTKPLPEKNIHQVLTSFTGVVRYQLAFF